MSVGSVSVAHLAMAAVGAEYVLKNTRVLNQQAAFGISPKLPAGTRRNCKLSRSTCRSSLNSSTEHLTTYIEEFGSRKSSDEVRKEILMCYDLVEKLGRGAVYMGSARTNPDHPHFLQAMELGKEVALLLNCTSWSGVGPGLMDAATKGAMQAGKLVGGFRTYNEGGVWTDTSVHPYLLPETFITCRFFSARKHGLVAAGLRDTSSDRTAFIALPGGVGTMDEIFEILTLIQLERIGTKFPVPFLVINYDGFYDHLLEFFATCRSWGTIAEGEVEALWKVCKTNSEALEYLSNFYEISGGDRKFRGRLREATA